MIINDNTRLIDLTIGELRSVIMDMLPKKREDVEYVKGLSGLCELLGCRRSKANKLKTSGRLDGTYIQEGRIILFDKEKVINRLKYGN